MGITSPLYGHPSITSYFTRVSFSVCWFYAIELVEKMQGSVRVKTDRIPAPVTGAEAGSSSSSSILPSPPKKRMTMTPRFPCHSGRTSKLVGEGSNLTLAKYLSLYQMYLHVLDLDSHQEECHFSGNTVLEMIPVFIVFKFYVQAFFDTDLRANSRQRAKSG